MLRDTRPTVATARSRRHGIIPIKGIAESTASREGRSPRGAEPTAGSAG